MRRWDRHAPPPGKLNAWDAGTDSAHVTCENGARDTFPQVINSVEEPEGGFDTGQYPFPPDPHQGHARDQRLAIQDQRTRQLLPASTGVLRQTQPATPDGASRHQSTSRATLNAKHRTATLTRLPHNQRDTARYCTRQAGRHEHEHRTTQPERHPGAPTGSTGMHQGGAKGPCHRQGCTYQWHRRGCKDGRRALRNTG